MKNCVKCGNEMNDKIFVCPKCNYNHSTGVYAQKGEKDSTNELQLAAKIFMIISCVITGFLILPLCWTIPMTVYYSNKTKTGEKVSLAFKICTLIFVNTISGILMLVDNADVD